MKIIFLVIFLKFCVVFGFDCGISPLATKKYNPVIGGDNFSFDYVEDRILGGDESVEQHWPWIASFGINEEGYLLHGWNKKYNISFDDFFFDCTATIIHEKWILIAAHCVNNYRKSIPYLKIGVGSIDFRKQVFHKIKDFYEHPHYIDLPMDIHFDIGLIELEQPIIFNENISPICLPKIDNLKIGEFFVAAGWGLIFDYMKNESSEGHKINPLTPKNTDSTILQEEILAINNGSKCGKFLNTKHDGKKVSDYFVCHHGVNSGVSKGDSGGPLMTFKNGKWIQVGITSWGKFYNRPNNRLDLEMTVYYSKVNYFCNWIAKTTNNEVSCQH